MCSWARITVRAAGAAEREHGPQRAPRLVPRQAAIHQDCSPVAGLGARLAGQAKGWREGSTEMRGASTGTVPQPRGHP